MNSDAPWTIGRLLEWTTDFLREKGADSPRLDAEVLLAHARGCQRIDLYTAFAEEADEPLRQTFRALVGRRAAGEPVAHLVGHREFFSLEFRVTPDVLIPRPETELLVVRALDLAKQYSADGETREIHVADVGTGSGVLAICCAKLLPDTFVTAIDISPAALEIARHNALSHEVSDRIELVQSDLFENLPAEKRFDLIVSNPPYVTSAEMELLDGDVRRHEPRVALDGGLQGTDVIERLIQQANQRLRPGGWLLMEISPMIAERVEQLASDDSYLQLHDTLTDLSGLARVLQAQLQTASPSD